MSDCKKCLARTMLLSLFPSVHPQSDEELEPIVEFLIRIGEDDIEEIDDRRHYL